MKVLLRPIAIKYLERLDAPTRARFIAAFTDLSKEPPQGDIKSMTGQSGYYRLRVGGFRALYRVENNIIFVTNIDPRGQAYKKNKGGR